jgi:hypothetical protein
VSTYTLNPDGTVTIPLRGEKDPIVLPEPSIAQLAEMTSWVIETDEGMPPIGAIDQSDPVAMAALQGALRERTKVMYAADAPYGTVVCRIVKLLTGTDITLDDLPAWAAAPSVTNKILGHWQSPLVGED